jgi:beta-lactam-binding protein with PASTA domain
MCDRKRLSIVTLLVVFVVVLMGVTGCAGKAAVQVAVPDLAGKTATDAASALSAAKLAAGTAADEFSDTIEAGQVTTQSPSPGAQVAEGSAVAFTVSKGKPPVQMPDLGGMDAKEAEAALTAVGLDMLPYDEFDPEIPKGNVLGQLPEAASDAPVGSTAIVGISMGKAPADKAVPGVVGKSSSAAEKRLKKGGFKVTRHTVHAVGTKKGVVIAQAPKKGAKSAANSHVIILVSSGSPVGTIPDVGGMKRHKAATTLKGAGFDTLFLEMATVDLEKGKVFAQAPTAGTKELHGTEVAYVVSLGDPGEFVPEAAPDVTRLDETEAKKEIKAAGFKPFVVYGHDASVAKGQVITQVPAVGDSAVKGQDFLILVSKGGISKVESKMPSVVKKSQSAATKAIQKAGLRVRVGKLYSPTVAKGKVMAQLPKAGTKVTKNAVVEIVVSKGKHPAKDVTMPMVIGTNAEQAVATLEDLGLVPITMTGPSTGEAFGAVMGQFPKEGAKVRPGSQVVIAIVR